jgi:hypothetical protein
MTAYALLAVIAAAVDPMLTDQHSGTRTRYAACPSASPVVNIALTSNLSAAPGLPDTPAWRSALAP